MRTEIVELLAAAAPGVFVDATVGGGGHAAAVLEAAPQLTLVGIDRDPQALAAAAQHLAPYGNRVTLRQARFDGLAGVLDVLGEAQIAACLFDLGVSSPQLDQPERGFSYHADGPLDMRMDPSDPVTAADIVNNSDPESLAALLYRNADERHSRRIAAAIVGARPLHTTGELARVVAAAVPAQARRRAHPARRTFQALRIEVNRELDVIEPALQVAFDRLITGGRAAVLAYHSGEDRIVKNVMRRAAGEPEPGPAGLPRPPAPVATVRLLGRRARMPTDAEQLGNPRSASARLRAVERLCVAVEDA